MPLFALNHYYSPLPTIEGVVYYAQTEYSVVEAGGKFEGMTGSFKSWGTTNLLKFASRPTR